VVPPPAAAVTPPPAHLTLVTPAPASARDEVQDPPVLLRSKSRLGGYGALTVAYSRMLGRDGALIGAEGALLVEHRLSIGLAGYGFARRPRGPNDLNGDSQRFESGYGGLSLHYLLLTQSPLCFSFGALVGGGAVTLGPSHYSDRRDDWEDRVSTDAFFVIEPQIGAHATLTRWMRIGATASYRFVSGVSRFGFDNSDVNGVVLGSNIQLGWL
jgi:hypothetical protein